MPEARVQFSLRGPLAEPGQQTFNTWNAAKQICSRDSCVPALATAQAAATPNATALVMGGDVLTYSQLDARSNQLARHLRSVGVKADVSVALCLPRSMALVVGALGVMKAGGAYIPLDPAYPRERIAWMLDDAQPAVLLTQQSLAERISPGKWRTIEIDIEAPSIARHSSEPIGADVGPQNLAYIIYTSGSTGRPKGVQIAHHNLSNLVSWHQRAFDVTPLDRASQLASPGFDAAVWELWPYLTSGASVHIADESIRAEPESLCYWLVSQRITIAFVPTPLAERMITLNWPAETMLRILLTGADTLRTYPRLNLPFTLINNYGPTECTVVATSGPVHPNGNRNTPPSIGWPISNVQVYILDQRLQRAPVGVVGEMYIGGAGVGQGYMNAPELTAEKFVTDPFDTETSKYLYRTGDLGCFLPDGQIAFRGRIDDQIKIRGYRIEPNEIVASLAKHPAIEANAVIAREDTGTEKQLIAYVVIKTESQVSASHLREFLSGQLPEYMIPAAFVRIESLPLNTSGKVDRTALPKPDESNLLRDNAEIAPRTPIEQRIAEILTPLLGVPSVGVEDNFFMLGGHSLLGTQLIARVREIFGVNLSLRTLFDSPTVAALAAEVERLLYVRLEAMSEEEAEQFLRCATDPGKELYLDGSSQS